MDNEKEEESKVDSNKSEEIENDGVNLKHNEVKQDTKIPPVLQPQRLKTHKLDYQFSKFLEVFKKLQINIPFAEALEQIPKFRDFVKEKEDM